MKMFQSINNCPEQGCHASLEVLKSPVIFIGKFPGPGSPGKWSRSWKVLEFARRWCG